MFNFSKSICFISAISAVLLQGCASAPPIKPAPPSPPSTTASVVSDELPSGGQKYAYTDLEGTYFGVSGATGSLAVGLLLGPIGVAANVAHVNSVNRKRAAQLSALTSKNLSIVLREQLSAASDETGKASTSYKLTPAANLFFNSDNTYWLGCTITAELPQGGDEKPWTARYAIPIEGLFDSTNNSDTTKASNALSPCLRSAHQLFEEHVAGKLAGFETRTVVSKKADGNGSIEQQLQVVVPRLPERILVNDFFGVSELRASEVIQIK